LTRTIVTFKVRDTTTGKVYADHGDADYADFLGEKWCSELLYCDMCCFVLTQDGELYLLDECGKYGCPPQDRFVVFDIKVEQI